MIHSCVADSRFKAACPSFLRVKVHSHLCGWEHVFEYRICTMWIKHLREIWWKVLLWLWINTGDWSTHLTAELTCGSGPQKTLKDKIVPHICIKKTKHGIQWFVHCVSHCFESQYMEQQTGFSSNATSVAYTQTCWRENYPRTNTMSYFLFLICLFCMCPDSDIVYIYAPDARRLHVNAFRNVPVLLARFASLLFGAILCTWIYWEGADEFVLHIDSSKEMHACLHQQIQIHTYVFTTRGNTYVSVVSLLYIVSYNSDFVFHHYDTIFRSYVKETWSMLVQIRERLWVWLNIEKSCCNI